MTREPRKPRITVDDLDVQAVAYLYGEGYRQEDIKAVLNMSQATVSRSVQRAIDRGWLESKIRFVSEKFLPERVELIEARASPRQRLTEQLKKLAEKHGVSYGPQVRVFPSTTIVTYADADGWGMRLQRFGQDVAEYIRDLLLPAKVCGISWGRTIRSIEQGLRQLDPLPSRAEKSSIIFIPLCGVPLGEAGMQFSASSLAAQFHEIMNGDTVYFLHLAALPALIPIEISDPAREAIKTLQEYSPTYRKIFPPENRKILPPENSDEVQEEGLINRMDTMITSIGSEEDPQGYWRNSILSIGGDDARLLVKLTLGDIGGILFPRPNLSPEDEKLLVNFNFEERWTGIKEDHMRQCAKKAARIGTTGVILVAIGAHKTTSVCESVKRGLVNVLVIDRDLADNLADKLAKELETS